MEKVYLVCWESWGPCEDYYWSVVSVHKSEESAKKLVDILNDELKKKRERFSYLYDHVEELVFDIDGELRDTPEAREWSILYEDPTIWDYNGHYFTNSRNYELCD